MYVVQRLATQVGCFDENPEVFYQLRLARKIFNRLRPYAVFVLPLLRVQFTLRPYMGIIHSLKLINPDYAVYLYVSIIFTASSLKRIIMQRPNPSFFLVLLSFYILIANSSFAQAPQWLITSGGTGDDGGVHTRVMPNGNVVVCGNFRNTIDLDPSSATYNITSHNATQDMYLACYSPTGAFIRGIAGTK